MFYSEVHSERQQVLVGKWKIPNSVTGGKKIYHEGGQTLGQGSRKHVGFPSSEVLRTQLPRALKNRIYLEQDLQRSLSTNAILSLHEQNSSRIHERDFALDCSPTLGGSSLAATREIRSQQQAATARAVTEQLLASEAAYLHKARLSEAAQLGQFVPSTGLMILMELLTC